MARAGDSFSPPFCPNPDCVFHRDSKGWRFRKKGFFVRRAAPRRIQRYRCLHCHRNFSSQTFHVTYWLKRPDLLAPLLLRSLACSAYRQIAREFSVSPSAIQHQIERLGRHCLLFHELHRPKGPPTEPLVIDGFETFEFSQYSPGHFHLAVGRGSHFFYGFGDSELRRKGRMNDAQKRRRAELEATFGRPDPQSIEKEMAALLEWVIPPGTPVEIHSDEHPAYPRAFRRLSDRPVVHRTTSSKEPRTSHNPLFPVNLLDLLIRHGSANHKRETIAFSKQRGCAAYRLAILLVWRNYMKPFSERRRDATPAQRLGLVGRLLGVAEVLGRRLFPSRIRLPERWARYYWRRVRTRRLPDAPEHCRVFAV